MCLFRVTARNTGEALVKLALVLSDDTGDMELTLVGRVFTLLMAVFAIAWIPVIQVRPLASRLDPAIIRARCWVATTSYSPILLYTTPPPHQARLQACINYARRRTRAYFTCSRSRPCRTWRPLLP